LESDALNNARIMNPRGAGKDVRVVGMTDSGEDELLKLITNEINIGFTLLETANLSGSESHKQQALGDARSAYQTACHFLPRLSGAETDGLVVRLAELKSALDGFPQA
jgi:hypothetical protein